MARDNESIPKVRISYGAVVLRKNRTRPDSNPRPYDRDIHDRRLRPLRHNWDIEVGNEWIVPCNPYLSSQFDCHLNVELCSSVKNIKYVIKYVHKGSDQAVFALQRVDQDGNVIDEILMYQNARYIGSIEACWRLLGFGVHDRSPAVVRLAVHLPNGQRVTFNENNINEVAAGNPPKITLTEFFTLCSVVIS